MSVDRLSALRLRTGTLPAACLAALWLVGCGQTDSPTASSTTGSSSKDSHSHDHGHDHPTEGPHHGKLIELGNEEYHAEIVHADSGEVTIYVLDGSAKNAVPIEATEVVINLSLDGKAEQFKLPAVPDEGDPEGKSSRFVFAEKQLGENLDAKGSTAKLVLTINGKQYSGKIDHDHGHDHAH